ncbi:SDR family NAD(P)-dependent oxidoreductase [Amycolatopsis sp. GM8]|uniref:SDR family NAD(P)-dependent oxidoreductase n=1 Tax=Amycolatopsis sp. GM8 TaxID=2896530 RepID=UPI001F2779B7|nr:SDR family NAD(P)-dependent oxidoreductase [Amycolatopsis sp. GM8]
MGKLEGKSALVTGAGRGIGRAIALKLASEGASVVVNDLDAEPSTEVADKIKAAGGRAVAVPGSVTGEGFADRFVGAAVESFGGVDIVINNAGYTWDNVIQKISDEQWHAIVDLHLKAPFDILRAAQPVISAAAKKEREQGVVVHRKVVNISSVSGLHGSSGQANYSAAKAGIVGLTKTLAHEWGRYHVNVNCVAFGFIETRLTAPTGVSKIEVEGREINVGVRPEAIEALKTLIPLGRAGTPDEAAGSVVMLTYPEADFVSGQVITTAGGYEY